MEKLMAITILVNIVLQSFISLVSKEKFGEFVFRLISTTLICVFVWLAIFSTSITYIYTNKT